MARHDLTRSHHDDSVFAIAGKLAATAADRDAIRHEEDLERLYHLRMARRIAAHASSLDSLELAKLAGWAA